MGNKSSGPDPPLHPYQEEPNTQENPYSRQPVPLPNRMPERVSPPAFPKRSYSGKWCLCIYLCAIILCPLLVLERPKAPEPSYPFVSPPPPPISRTSSMSSSALQGYGRPTSSLPLLVNKNESPLFDDVADHLFETTPRDGAKDVPLGVSIVILFDKDVRSVNAAKLFEVIYDDCCFHYVSIKGANRPNK